MTNKEKDQAILRYSEQVYSMNKLLERSAELTKSLVAEIRRLRATVQDKDMTILRMRYEIGKLETEVNNVLGVMEESETCDIDESGWSGETDKSYKNIVKPFIKIDDNGTLSV